MDLWVGGWMCGIAFSLLIQGAWALGLFLLVMGALTTYGGKR